MSYELRLPERVQREITEYVQGRIDGAEDRAAAVEAIISHLRRLEQDPLLGTAPKGYFEYTGRYLYPFRIDLDGVGRYVQVAYRVQEEERAILAVGFKAVEL